MFADFKEGVRFIFTHATLAFTILSMAAGLFAVRCYSALIAVYVRDILHASTGLFGALGTLVGAGMIVGTQVVTRLGKTRSLKRAPGQPELVLRIHQRRPQQIGDQCVYALLGHAATDALAMPRDARCTCRGFDQLGVSLPPATRLEL